MNLWLPRLFAATFLYATITGCVTFPSIRSPGNIAYQQNRATLHDPYTDNDIGPEVVGGRPREFSKPLAEPVRNQMYRESWWNR